MNFYCWGTNFRIIGLEKLEKISLRNEDLSLLYQKFNERKIQNIVIISTCNRLEFYWAGPEDLRSTILSILKDLKNDIITMVNDFYFLSNFDAFNHLSFVILGFDSALNIEEEVFVQVKNSYLLAKNLLNLGKTIHLIFQNVIHLSRLIKNKYALSRFEFSLSDYLIKIVMKIFSSLSEKNLLIIGTGLVAKNVINKVYNKVRSVSVYSHSRERINNLIVNINKKINKVTELSNLRRFDIIISATVSDGFLIDEKCLRGSKKNNIILFDLGLPRNIAPDIANMSGVFLFTLDDIYNFHTVLFKEKEHEFELLKNEIAEDIYEVWGKILLNNESIDWFDIKKKIESEVYKSLNPNVCEIDSTIVNKIAHNILKSIKEYLVKCNLLLEQEEAN